MNSRPKVSPYLPMLALAFALTPFAISGCNKSADQPATSTTPDTSSSAPAGSAPAAGASGAATAPDSSAAMKASAPTPPPPPPPLVVPAETVLSVNLDQAVGSKISTPGQAFSATVAAPVSVGGRLAIPKGTRVAGVVKDAKSAGRFKGGAVLSLTLTSVTIKNENYDIQTSAPTETSTVREGFSRLRATRVAMFFGVLGNPSTMRSFSRLAKA